MTLRPAIIPPLDPAYLPAVLWNRAYRQRCEGDTGARRLAVALKRPDGTISRYDAQILSDTEGNRHTTNRFVERLVKFLLWARGGSRLFIGGDRAVAENIQRIYSGGGERKFDYDFMGGSVYREDFSVEVCALEEVPAAREGTRQLGRHFDGCRIGFDLGGSDRKLAAVIDGECVYSEEVPWDPYFQSDPAYHYAGINDCLKRAAAKLPRVDAIGGSAAGVYVNNEIRAGSLYRGIARADFEAKVRHLFFDLKREWGGVPFEVANDGEVTALAGSMVLGENSVLGISMGTSVAAGYVTEDGAITAWLNELAFAPVDYQEDGPIDEWSADRGSAVQYFCQQGIARLAPRAGLLFPDGMSNAARLVTVQDLMKSGDPRARQIYETVGICFGYAIAHFADFYDIRNLLILGRVTSGEGGSIILDEAGKVLHAEFPELAERIKLRIPSEKDKRHGQAVAAASLPAIVP